MKYAIPLGTILLVGVAALIHRSGLPETVQERSKSPQMIPVRKKSAVWETVGSRNAPESIPVSVLNPSKSVTAATTSPREPWRKMFGQLDYKVELTTIQRISVEQILRERELEIQACHQEFVKVGVIDFRHYEWKAGLMKDSWYRRIDALLDRVQHERFVALVQNGFLNEGFAFTVEPGMTVLE